MKIQKRKFKPVLSDEKRAAFLVKVNIYEALYRLEELTRPEGAMADAAVNTFVRNFIVKEERKC